MEKMNKASENPNSNVAFLNSLTLELNEIRTVNEMILQKNADLCAQIARCEARQEYVKAALEEGQKIAQEVTRNAEARVENILAKAQKDLVPQQEQIVSIEKERIELSEEISLGALMKQESASKVTEIASIRRGFSLREYLYADFCDNNKLIGNNEIFSSDIQPVMRREFSMREPQPLDIEDVPVINQPEPSAVDLRPTVGREFSLREPQFMDIPEDVPEVNQAEPTVAESRPAVGREFSLREPQQLDIPLENLDQKNLKQDGQQLKQYTPHHDYCLTEPLVEEISNYDLAMSLVEQNGSKMHLDAFVDVRYSAANGDQPGQMQRHSWQVKIDVEVPDNNREFVGYGKVSSAVTATLLRYDNVVLNDIFPFAIITPNPENIINYFYNSLEDTVTLMGLILEKITVWDSQTLVMEVNSRKCEFDDLLQGDDILKGIRSLFTANEQGHKKSDTGRRMGHIFKR